MAKKNKLPVSTDAIPMGYKRTKDQIEQDRRWRAEEDMRTLTRAEEISGDSSRMKAVKTIAKEQMEAAKKFCK